MIVYIVALKRTDGSMPPMEAARGLTFYLSYAYAQKAIREESEKIRDAYGVFTVNADIQQLVTHDVPF